jgi:hypothetical protein
MNFESNSENSIIVKEKITITENKYRVFLQWNITHVVSEKTTSYFLFYYYTIFWITFKIHNQIYILYILRFTDSDYPFGIRKSHSSYYFINLILISEYRACDVHRMFWQLPTNTEYFYNETSHMWFLRRRLNKFVQPIRKNNWTNSHLEFQNKTKNT